MEDRSLVRTRSKFVKESTRNKNRIKSYLYFNGIDVSQFDGSKHWSNKFLQQLEEVQFARESGKLVLTGFIDHQRYLRQEVLKFTKEIRKLSQQEKYCENVRLLKTIPGVGLITAMIFLTEIGDILRFRDVDHYCSYIGFVPSTKSSGEKVRTGSMTSRTNKAILNAIVESAWVAVRHDAALRSYYHKHCLRMEPNQAIIRVAKRLAKTMRSVVKNKTEYFNNE